LSGSLALDDAGGVGPPRNIPDMPSSARGSTELAEVLAIAADRSPRYAADFRDGTLAARIKLSG